MKPGWITGGSNDSHFLIAAYCLVWIVQGGYFAWAVYQTTRVDRSRD